jgi:arsenite-transporting ATPase
MLVFAGKGGVGKSTCAAAAALALADTRDVLLCSTDPAGSLGDLLPDAGALPARLRVMQVEPVVELERLRSSARAAMLGALERIGLAESAMLDRRVLETIWDLAPPGLDEMAATVAMLRSARAGETIVIDSAPTGHFLRLLEMPDIALGWTRQLMRVFVKYGVAGDAGDAAASILGLARELRALRDALGDPAAAGVIVVTLAEPMVRAETDRLLESLRNASIAVPAIIVNRVVGHAPTAPVAGGPADTAILIAAPAVQPPAGVARLRGFIEAWNIVS